MAIATKKETPVAPTTVERRGVKVPTGKVVAHVYPSDWKSKAENGCNAEIIRQINGQIVHELVKMSSTGRNRTVFQLVGMALHWRLWNQSVRTSPCPGDKVVFHYKRKADVAYMMDKNRKIVQVL